MICWKRKQFLFIPRCLEKHKQLIYEGKINPEMPLCFNAIAGIAKSDPEKLRGDCIIDQKEMVQISQASFR